MPAWRSPRSATRAAARSASRTRRSGRGPADLVVVPRQPVGPRVGLGPAAVRAPRRGARVVRAGHDVRQARHGPVRSTSATSRRSRPGWTTSGRSWTRRASTARRSSRPTRRPDRDPVRGVVPGADRRLVLHDPRSRAAGRDGLPVGPDRRRLARLAPRGELVGRDGVPRGELRDYSPSVADDPEFKRWYVRHMRSSASPGAAAAFQRMVMEGDVTASCRRPRADARHPSPDVARAADYVPRHIPGAVRREIPASSTASRGRSRAQPGPARRDEGSSAASTEPRSRT